MIRVNLLCGGLEPEEVLVPFRDGVAVVRPPATLIGFLGEPNEKGLLSLVGVIKTRTCSRSALCRYSPLLSLVGAMRTCAGTAATDPHN